MPSSISLDVSSPSNSTTWSAIITGSMCSIWPSIASVWRRRDFTKVRQVRSHRHRRRGCHWPRTPTEWSATVPATVSVELDDVVSHDTAGNAMNELAVDHRPKLPDRQVGAAAHQILDFEIAVLGDRLQRGDDVGHGGGVGKRQQ